MPVQELAHQTRRVETLLLEEEVSAACDERHGRVRYAAGQQRRVGGGIEPVVCSVDDKGGRHDGRQVVPGVVLVAGAEVQPLRVRQERPPVKRAPTRSATFGASQMVPLEPVSTTTGTVCAPTWISMIGRLKSKRTGSVQLLALDASRDSVSREAQEATHSISSSGSSRFMARA